MRKFVVIAIVVAVAGGAAAYFGVFSREGDAAAAAGPQAGGPGGGGAPGASGRAGRGAQGGGAGGFGGGGFPGGGPGGGGGGPRVPMTVELGTLKRGKVSAFLTVVGNLIGEQTVDIAPRTGGRLLDVNVKLGDRVRRGQVLAKVEDREIVEQVRQAEASQEVSKATIRQREADLKVAELNFERSKNLYQRQLLAKQALDDAESRYMAAVAQFDLSKAQLMQNDSRLQELRINLQNTQVVSPVDGFVGKRSVDPGAMVNTNTAIASVVDISKMRLVANVVEKDLRMVSAGDAAVVEVDAYPGEKFNGKIARVSPVLDPSTRTAAMEVEIPNGDYRLKPGMYARINLTIEEHDKALVMPKTAIVDYQNQRGVWVPNESERAMFVPLKLGIENSEQIEVVGGMEEGARFVNVGAAAVRNNDQLLYAGQAGGPNGGGGGQGRGSFGGDGARKSQGQGQRPGGEGGQPRKRPQ
ncbi:MAG TPA: efflux RND transporter periplasmic adaptor subunit [Vicinamibacterales bacterium]|nr:efflux RND transporter periplasmic adaptor subunit [Vicinamibacterales bacterium]